MHPSQLDWLTDFRIAFLHYQLWDIEIPSFPFFSFPRPTDVVFFHSALYIYMVQSKTVPHSPIFTHFDYLDYRCMKPWLDSYSSCCLNLLTTMSRSVQNIAIFLYHKRSISTEKKSDNSSST